MAEKLRSYTTEMGDLIASDFPREAYRVLISNFTPQDFMIERTITENKITAFCQGCDAFKGEGVPCKVGANDQARYANRRYCGYSVINGESVQRKG